MIGVYKITNIINKKFYIGQSSNIKARWYYHKTKLKTNSHPNNELQREWNLYGSLNFKFNILIECETKELERLESDYIYQLRAIENGYNVNKPLDYSLITDREIMRYKKKFLNYIKKEKKRILRYSLIIKALNINYNILRIVLNNITISDEIEFNIKIDKFTNYGEYQNAYLTIENKSDIQKRAKDALSNFAMIQ